MIVPCTPNDFNDIHAIINDAASAYRGIIPADRWHEPYMSMEELKKQIDEGVCFWSYQEHGHLLGVMGIQDKIEVTLIRHAYVRSSERQKGIGGKLLAHLLATTVSPVLIGTWADAAWAIDFYRKHGFRVLPDKTKNTLLRRYWSIPERQAEVSVVLADDRWKERT
jgi:GNAT superfamily N-acetyltransferase